MSVSANLLEMPELQHLNLTWVTNGDGVASLQVLIGGINLQNLVMSWTQWERPEESHVLEYDGIRVWYALILEQWLPDTDRTITVLGCTCGELGCDSFDAIMQIDGQYVIWKAFARQRKRPLSNSFGPFTFHYAQYEAEVRRAIATAPE